MSDHLDFERQLERRLQARAAIAARPFDAGAIAHEIAAGTERRLLQGRFGWPRRTMLLAWLAVAAIVLATMAVVALIGAPTDLVFTGRPSNGLIAISANPLDVASGELGDIYVLDGDGAPRPVIGAPGDGIGQACPMFSPDGNWLAYGEAKDLGNAGARDPFPFSDPAFGVASIGPDGAVVPRMRELVGPTQNMPCPEFSPDSRSIVFADGDGLRLIDITTGATRSYPVSGRIGSSEWYAWSRDGTRVAVSEPGQIRIIRVNDGSSVVVPAQGTVSIELAWTAGDVGLLYMAADEFEQGYSVRLLDIASGRDTQIGPPAVVRGAEATVDAVAMSPDGRRIAYGWSTRTCNGDGCQTQPGRLFVVDVGSAGHVEAGHVELAPARESIGGTVVAPGRGLVWSPDGTRLLFGSALGLVSLGVDPASSATVQVHDASLNLEWSFRRPELAWQPVFR